MALGLLGLDMLTKFLTDGLDIEGTNIFVDIISVHNFGASWGMLSGHGGLFVVLAFVFVVLMLCYDFLVKKDNNENGWFFVGFNLVLAGIVGNAIDRIVFGYVRDFISLGFMNFPVFNVADVCLTVGTICIIVWLLFFYGKNKNKEKEKTNDNNS